MALLMIDWDPKERQLRQFALAGGAVCLLLAGLLWQRQVDSTMVWMLGTLGIGVGFLGGMWPETIRYLYVGTMALTYPIGWVMSHVVLGVIFYGVFTPVALFFRMIGRDVLQRRFEPTATTYWQRRQATPRPSRYLRQF